MNINEFIKLTESIGFKFNIDYIYVYKNFRIYFHVECYDFWNGSEWIKYIPYNDLEHIDKYLKKELRAIKLKHILGLVC